MTDQQRLAIDNYHSALAVQIQDAVLSQLECELSKLEPGTAMHAAIESVVDHITLAIEALFESTMID